MTVRTRLTGGRAGALVLAPALLLSVALAACGGSGGAAQGAGGSKECASFPSKDIKFVVPYSAGGGFDTWARLMAPGLKKHLGGKANVIVENQPGGGGMRAVNQVFSAPADGSTIIFTEPGYIAVNQILGRTAGKFDITKMTYLGQATADPQVFAVAGKSAVSSLEDLKAKPIKHAGQDISPIETITYGAYGVKAKYILHEGTSEVVLSVRRGDSDATVVSLSSILPFLESGDLKPILYVGTEEITPQLIGYEQLKNTPTAADGGHPELNEVLEQHRVVAAPPNLPGCVKDKLADALAKTLADADFKAKATAAELRVVPATADEAAATVAKTVSTFRQYKATLESALKD
jgi:tripartite-type tricarboxylate transporter receptor subunit TctC